MRLFILRDDKRRAFNHMLEVLDGLIHCQELAVVRTMHLLSGAELIGVESKGVAKGRKHAASRRRQYQYQKLL